MSMRNPLFHDRDVMMDREALTADERNAATRRLVAGVVLGILAVFAIVALAVLVL